MLKPCNRRATTPVISRASLAMGVYGAGALEGLGQQSWCNGVKFCQNGIEWSKVRELVSREPGTGNGE